MIHHFYHIYADGQCEQPIREHVRALHESGLHDELHTFAVGIVGSPQKRKEVINCLDTLGISYTICAEADTGWEQVTMIPMWEFSHRNEGTILYAHTKGAYSPIDVNTKWRRSMTYWNVLQWQLCQEKLRDHGAVGCHWIQPLISMPEHKVGNWMFAGTFFWTHCDLMRTWQAPALTHRHEAEGFVGYGWHEKPFPVWDHTPYFPNSNEFADAWVDDANFKSTMEGKSYG